MFSLWTHLRAAPISVGYSNLDDNPFQLPECNGRLRSEAPRFLLGAPSFGFRYSVVFPTPPPHPIGRGECRHSPSTLGYCGALHAALPAAAHPPVPTSFQTDGITHECRPPGASSEILAAFFFMSLHKSRVDSPLLVYYDSLRLAGWLYAPSG